MGNEMLGAIFGEEFKQKYESKKHNPMELNETDIVQIKKLIVEGKFDPSSASMFYMKDKYRFDVVLVETHNNPNIKQTKNIAIMKASATWMGKWVNLLLNNDMVPLITPNNTFFVIGQMKAGTFNGQPSLSFFTKKIVSMEELSAFKAELVDLK